MTFTQRRAPITSGYVHLGTGELVVMSGGPEFAQELGRAGPVGYGWRWSQNFETGECRGRKYAEAKCLTRTKGFMSLTATSAHQPEEMGSAHASMQHTGKGKMQQTVSYAGELSVWLQRQDLDTCKN